MTNLLDTGELKDKIAWYLRAHGHSCAGGLYLIRTYLDYNEMKTSSKAVQETITTLDELPKEENTETAIEKLEEKLRGLKKILQEEKIAQDKKKELIEVLEGVEKNIEKIRQITKDPDYEEPVQLEDVLLATIIQVKNNHPQRIHGRIAGNENEKNKKAIHIEEQIGEEENKLKVPGYELQLLLYNLINNAIEAIPEKGKITISVQKKIREYQISITDNGEGMDKETLEKIRRKEAFTTKNEGHGKGLRITYDIIEKNKGTLQVQSKKGETTFTITLPIEKQYY